MIEVTISEPSTPNISSNYDALIDTGATKTFISDKVVADLKLPVTNLGTVTDASGKPRKVNLYTISLLLEGHTQWIKLECGVTVSRKECEVIIGMDIIQHGELHITNGQLNFEIKALK